MGGLTHRKITAEKARKMRELYAAGESQAVLAERFGVDNSVVSRCVRGESWAGAGGPLSPKKEKKADEDWYEVDGETGCWMWGGRTNPGGYGIHATGYDAGYSQLAYRYFYETRVGPVPEGKELDHTCHRKLCVNPAHLEPVTHAVNVRRKLDTKLNWPQVREIRSLYCAGGWTQKSLAEKFSVSRPTIQTVVRNTHWHDPAYSPPSWGKGSKKHLQAGGG